MFSVSRLAWYIGAPSSAGRSISGGATTDYRHSTDLADAFHSVYQHPNLAFDHVVVDVPFLIHSVAHLTRDYAGYERDIETVKIVQRQLQATLLRRLPPRKSLALLFDGSGPLWQLERTRLFPGRHYDSKFYRSCASPMPYLLEEKIRSTAMELRTPPAETMISGPATPGLSEGKISAYLLDLATRLLPELPTYPPSLCAAVSAADSICVVGAPDLAWLGLGMTPFQNITSVTLRQGELLCCPLRSSMEWLRLDHLLPPPSTTPTSKEGAEKRRLAAARTDVVFLHLLVNGHASTGLPQVLATPFADLMDAYIELEEEAKNANHPSSSNTPAPTAEEESSAQPCFRSFLFDEEPVTLAHADRPSLRLRVPALQRLLVRVYRHTVGATAVVPSSSRPTPHAATLLTMALQTHSLLCSGGVSAPDWSPTPDTHGNNTNTTSPSTPSKSAEGSGAVPLSGTTLLDKFPKLGTEQLLQHLSYLMQTSPTIATAGNRPLYLNPPFSRRLGLTGAETLLLTATQPDQIQQLLPLYVRGHSLPDGVAEDIVSTRNVHEALRKTQRVLGRAVEKAEQELASMARHAGTKEEKSTAGATTTAATAVTGPHPALTHLPSHLYVRTAGSAGPPPGWEYYGVYLGTKAEAMNVRYRLNAANTNTPPVMNAAIQAEEVKKCRESEVGSIAGV